MSTGAKMRVYEIAREVGIPNKDLLAKIRALGLEVNNHMSSIDADDVVRIKRSLEKERQAAQSTETHQLSAGAVLRRRSNKPEGDSAPAAEARPAPVAPPPAAVPVRRRAVEPQPQPAPTPAPTPEPPPPVTRKPVVERRPVEEPPAPVVARAPERAPEVVEPPPPPPVA